MIKSLKLISISSTFVFCVFMAASVASAVWVLDAHGNLIDTGSDVLGKNSDQTPAAGRTGAPVMTISQDDEEDGETIQSRLESKGDVIQVRQEVQNEAGETLREGQTELPARERLRIETKNGAALELKAMNGQFEMTQNQTRIRTSHPLTIGDNNELIITRPDGSTRTVTVLPDQAADRLRDLNFTPDSESSELTVESDNLVYRFTGHRTRRFLGLIPTSFEETVSVSAETGELTDITLTTPSLLQRLFSALSF